MKHETMKILFVIKNCSLLKKYCKQSTMFNRNLQKQLPLYLYYTGLGSSKAERPNRGMELVSRQEDGSLSAFLYIS